jgi:hypothetical protein
MAAQLSMGPECDEEAEAAAAAAKVAAAWTTAVDPDTGAAYWWNAITNESRWVEEDTEDAAADDESSEVSESDETDFTDDESDAEGAAVEAVEATPSKARRRRSIVSNTPGVGASEWIEYTDPETGAIFFYNSSTDESRWEQPAEMAVAEAQREAAEPTPSRARRSRSIVVRETVDAETGSRW